MADRVLFTGITPDTGIPGDNITSASDITLFGTTNGDPFIVAFSAGGDFPQTTVTGDNWTATLTGLLPGTYEMIVWDIPYYDLFGTVQFFNFTILAADPVTASATGWAGTVSGNNGNDTLTSAFSSATLNGLGGADSLSATGWADSLLGGAGNDILSATGSSSLLDGGEGNDSITASGWGSIIRGGPGDDLITVNADSASIEGGAGRNTIHANGWGETITGGNDGNIVDGPTGGASITLGDGANQVTISGWGNHVTTGSGADLVTVLAGGNNVIATGGGNDRVALGLGGGETVTGAETVSYSGAFNRYGIHRNPDGSLSVTGPGGTDLLTGATLVRFADGHFDPEAPTRGDLNGDHRAELLFQNDTTGELWSYGSSGWVDLGNIYHGLHHYQALFSGNLLGLATRQVVAQDGDDGVEYATTDGATLGTPVVPSLPSFTWDVVGLDDFAGTGQDSILQRSSFNGGLRMVTVSAPDVVAQNGQAAIITEIANPGLGWVVIGTGDFDGDGRADILFHTAPGVPAAAATYYIWEMDGTAIKNGGAAQAAMADPNYTGGVANGGSWAVKAIADLDGNGTDDLVWQDQIGNLYLWEMAGLAPSAYLSLGNVGTWWSLIGAADLSGDGKADLVFRGQDGTLWTWQMNGAQITGGGGIGNVGSDWHLVH